MWGKIIIPMYRLWLHGLCGLYGPRSPLSPKRTINLISLSLPERVTIIFWAGDWILSILLNLNLDIIILANYLNHTFLSTIKEVMPHSNIIGRTVPLLKPPQGPHCYLGEVDLAKKSSPPPPATRQAGLIALIGPLRPYCSPSPLILLRCVTEIKFAQNLR